MHRAKMMHMRHVIYPKRSIFILKEAHALVGKDAHLYQPDSRSSPASHVFDVGTRDCLATKSSSWRGSRLEQEQGTQFGID